MGSGLMQVMEITDIERRLNQMREAQVVLRQVSISKQDMLQLREAQLNQSYRSGHGRRQRLAEAKTSEEAARSARRSASEHTSRFELLEDESGDSSTL